MLVISGYELFALESEFSRPAAGPELCCAVTVEDVIARTVSERGRRRECALLDF